MGIKVVNSRDQHLEYEDYEVGDEFIAPPITITETHLVLFSSLFGDQNLGHSCDHFTKEVTDGIAAGRKVVQGHLVMVMGQGLLARMGVMAYTKTGAYLGMPIWKILRPAYVGDSIYSTFKVIEKKPHPTKSQWGILKFEFNVYNYAGEKLQTGENLHYFRVDKK
jgi:acyl dehydratase